LCDFNIFVTEYLKSRGKRVIPESEIGLAVLHCSVDRHCNPDYSIASALIPKGTGNVGHPEVVLALDTQDSESESIKRIREAARETVIPESGTVRKPEDSAATSAPRDVKNGRDWTETKDASVSITDRTIEKERPPIQDEVDASFVSRKR
jgi:nijmegen breakage syndrome protein 1